MDGNTSSAMFAYVKWVSHKMNNYNIKLNNGVVVSFFIIALITLVHRDALSDTWINPPESRKVYSADKSCFFEINLHLKSNEIGKDMGSYSSGSLYRIPPDKKYYKKWTIRLINEFAPVNALVSDSGFVVTFDDHHRAGYGDNVVVIYGPEGNLIRRFSLRDIASRWNISRMIHTVSSIVWRSDKSYIDNERQVVVLNVVSKGTWPVNKGTTYHDVKIDLKRGEIIKWWKLW